MSELHIPHILHLLQDNLEDSLVDVTPSPPPFPISHCVPSAGGSGGQPGEADG